jgi:hypothetical protein
MYSNGCIQSVNAGNVVVVTAEPNCAVIPPNLAATLVGKAVIGGMAASVIMSQIDRETAGDKPASP